MLATIKLIQTSAKQQLRYKTAMLGGMVTNFAWGIFRYYLVNAFYFKTTSINGLSQQAAATYVPLSQSLMVFLDTFGLMDISQAVHRGEIGSMLLRPMSFIRYWVGYYCGRSLINLIIRGLILYMGFSLIFPTIMPESLSQWGLFLMSLMLSWIISHLWIICINLSAFWLTDATGVLRLAFAMQQLLTGMLFPLRLLPEWLMQLCYWTPFPSMMNTPIEIFTNSVATNEVLSLIFLQIIWAALLYIITIIVYKAGIRRLVLMGG